MYGAAADGEVIGAVAAIATARNVSMAQVALAWVLSKPGVTAPIIGVSKPHHLDDAIGALALKLDEQEIERLEAAYQPRPISGHK